MPELKIDVEVWCECGAGLCHQSAAATKGTGVVVEPCESCLDNAKEEGDSEGYIRGVSETEERVGGC